MHFLLNLLFDLDVDDYCHVVYNVALRSGLFPNFYKHIEVEPCGTHTSLVVCSSQFANLMHI